MVDYLLLESTPILFETKYLYPDLSGEKLFILIYISFFKKLIIAGTLLYYL